MKKVIGVFLVAMAFVGSVAEAARPNSESQSRLTYDLGLSTGSYGGETYTEADFGLNYFFKPWMAWRNALFARFVQPENFYGLDSSLRFFHFLNFGEKSGATLFAGPGYRFATADNTIPFAEGGLIMHFGNFSIGGGLKAFFYGLRYKDAPTNTQFFIILAGGGAL